MAENPCHLSTSVLHPFKLSLSSVLLIHPSTTSSSMSFAHAVNPFIRLVRFIQVVPPCLPCVACSELLQLFLSATSACGLIFCAAVYDEMRTQTLLGMMFGRKHRRNIAWSIVYCVCTRNASVPGALLYIWVLASGFSRAFERTALWNAAGVLTLTLHWPSWASSVIVFGFIYGPKCLRWSLSDLI